MPVRESPYQRRLNIGLCVIATGKYTRFVSALWESARQYFLCDHSVTLLLFSDQQVELPPGGEFFPAVHFHWPGPTLYRYHTMLAYREQLERMDYLFYCDADMRFVAPVQNEVLGDLVATHHPCSYARPRPGCPYFSTPHHSPESKKLGCQCGRHYFAGAFQGGRTPRYLDAMEDLRRSVDEDDRRGLIAEWYDETHWNQYLSEFRPDVELSPSYCYPDWQTVPFEPRLRALCKPEKELRS